MAAVVPVVRVDRDTEERFRLGERDAFAAVYDRHAPAVQALVAGYFGRAFEREEAVQEVWLQIHRVAGSFDAGRARNGQCRSRQCPRSRGPA